MISNQSRPTEVSRELYDYYIRHENGRELLEGVKVVPGTTEAEAAGGAGQKEVRTPFVVAAFFVLGFVGSAAAPAHARQHWP